MNVDPFPDCESSPGAPQSLRARWVIPVDGPPLENATVEITAGRISAIHQSVVPGARDFGNAAIIPGLVNAHTHLELSDVATPLLPNTPFTSWLKAVMAHRHARTKTRPDDGPMKTAGDDRQPIVEGRAECLRGGTTTIGDIAGVSEAIDDSGKSGPREVAFLELLGLARERIAGQLERARSHIARGSNALPGLSPHAPYSVHPDLFRGLVELAVANRVPLAMHLAETRAELELLSQGTGEFVPFLEELGVWRSDAIPRGCRPLDYLEELARVEHALVIHGNYLADDEIDYLAGRSNISVVYCPRTHAFFGHTPHPWQRLVARGINVALGTDSRASNPDLGLWNELLFLRILAPEFDPALFLKLGTLNGARALGLESEIGSLTVGKAAELTIVEFAQGRSTDPYSQLFFPKNRIAAVLCRGEWLLD